MLGDFGLTFASIGARECGLTGSLSQVVIDVCKVIRRWRIFEAWAAN